MVVAPVFWRRMRKRPWCRWCSPLWLLGLCAGIAVMSPLWWAGARRQINRSVVAGSPLPQPAARSSAARHLRLKTGWNLDLDLAPAGSCLWLLREAGCPRAWTYGSGSGRRTSCANGTPLQRAELPAQRAAGRQLMPASKPFSTTRRHRELAIFALGTHLHPVGLRRGGARTRAPAAPGRSQPGRPAAQHASMDHQGWFARSRRSQLAPADGDTLRNRSPCHPCWHCA